MKLIIKAIYDKKEYKSSIIEFSENSETAKVIRDLSEKGTDGLTMFKMPLNDNEYMIFSRAQLDATLFKISILED